MFSLPLTIDSNASSSTSIKVEWSPLDPSAQTAGTSSLSGYIIFYKTNDQDRYQWVAVAPTQVEKTVENLEKFTVYRIVVSPYSANGNGVPSSPLQNTTLEDGTLLRFKIFAND